ncbi:Uncharacterised protein [Shigella sonnei]|nr:Uncharacterised protein [Shigella sonnei]
MQKSLSPLFVDIEISFLLNRHFITLFTLFMTCRNRRLINLFVIFNRERLAIVLFIKLITLLVNFFKGFFAGHLLTVCIFSPICIRCFLRRHHLLIKRFHFLFQRRNRVLLGIQRRFKLTKAIMVMTPTY